MISPTQIRSARALLGWTQEQLATAAVVNLSSIQGIERLRRPIDTEIVDKLRRILENQGIVFVSNNDSDDRGVRLHKKRPKIIKPPRIMAMGEGLPFMVKWEGKKIRVMIMREVLDYLDQRVELASDAEYLLIFSRHETAILFGIVHASVNQENYDRYGRLYVRVSDINLDAANGNLSENEEHLTQT